MTPKNKSFFLLKLFPFLVVFALISLIAYPKIRTLGVFYLDESSSISSSKHFIFKFSDLFGLKKFEIPITKNALENRTIIIKELGADSSIEFEVEYLMNSSAVIRNSSLVSSIVRGDSYLKKTENNSYTLIRKDKVEIPEHIFEHEVMKEFNLSANESNTQNNLRYEVSKSQISVIKDIEFLAIIAEDYSSSKSVDFLIDDILTVTLDANQYLMPIGFRLVLVGVKIYRTSSPFTSAISERDPYRMLSLASDLHFQTNFPERQLSVLFSNTFFPNASGLSYVGTSCVNPRYSAIFLSSRGDSLINKITLSSTFAHEVGHYLGMSHDLNIYDYGVSLMSSSTTALPFGFSDYSIIQQQNHSAEGRDGGSCFKTQGSEIDTDGDGASDVIEYIYSSNSEDSGSYPKLPKKEIYSSWNSFNPDISIAELVSASELYGKVKLDIYNLNGDNIFNKTFNHKSLSQNDLILNNLLPQEYFSNGSNSYGLIKLSANFPINGQNYNYSYNSNMLNLANVSSHNFFSPITSNHHSFVSYNNFIPLGLPNGSMVSNWLSVINFSSKAENFIIESYDLNSNLLGSSILSIPAMGRKDVLPVSLELISNLGFSANAGFIKVYPESISREVPYHAFNSRYYYLPNLIKVASIYQDANIPSGEHRYVLIDKEIEALNHSIRQSWLEIVNTSNLSSEFTIRVFNENQMIDESKVSVSSLGSLHFPILHTAPVMVSVSSKGSSSEVRNPFIVSVFSYRLGSEKNYVESIPSSEAFKGEKTGSINTFLSSKSNLIIGNPDGEASMLSCTLQHNRSKMYVSKKFDKFYVKSVELKELFPTFPNDSYAPVRCNLSAIDGKNLPGVSVIKRIVQNEILVNHLMN